MKILACIALALCLRVQAADATCSDPKSDTWLVANSVPSSALQPVGAHPILERSVVAFGSSVRVAYTENLTGDGSDVTLTGAVENSPNPVQLDDSSYGVFLAQQNGYVTRVDPTTQKVTWSTKLSRAGCASDTLTATPAVHLRRYASASFQAAYSDDLVYVATRYGCGGNTVNRVYALNASDGSTAWIFNELGSVEMDAAYQDPYLDIENDRLIVGTDRTYASTQSSLWSIDVITGGLAWDANVGPMYTAPVVRGDRIFVATLYGEVKALSLADGSVIWSLSNGGIPITTNIFPEFRDPYDDLIAVVDFTGNVWMARDDDTSGTWVWYTAMPAAASSRVAIDPAGGKAFVGASDGKIYQLNMVDGAVEASRTVDSGATVGSPTLVFEDSDGNGSLDDVRIMSGASSGALAKFCYPWTVEASPLILPPPPGPDSVGAVALANEGTCTIASNCGSTPPNQCSTWACVQGVCVAQPVADGTTCNDGNSNTSLDRCSAGTCAGKSQCDRRHDLCRCADEKGDPVSRQLWVQDETLTSCPDPSQGQAPSEFWCGTEMTTPTVSTTCLGHGTNARSIVWVHLFDQDRRPITGASVAMTLSGGSGTQPYWVDPETFNATTPDQFDPISAGSVTTGNGVVESGREGTYYAMLAPDPDSGDPSQEDFQVTVMVSKTDTNNIACNTEQQPVIQAKVRMGAASSGCLVSGDVNEASYLRITVKSSSGDPVQNAPVLIGWAQEQSRFYTKYESFVTLQAGDPNFLRTNSKGQVEFFDFGNSLNGGPSRGSQGGYSSESPGLRVVVGYSGDEPGTGEKYFVTAADTTITLP